MAQFRRNFGACVNAIARKLRKLDKKGFDRKLKNAQIQRMRQRMRLLCAQKYLAQLRQLRQNSRRSATLRF